VTLRPGLPEQAGATWWLTRFVILRFLGLVYLTGFLVAAHQLVPLIGHHGITPADTYMERVEAHFGGKWEAFWELPALFYWNCSDAFLQGVAWTGVVLSALVLVGFANVPIMLVLWFLYLSIIHTGGLWYGYGWETQLLETGFLGALLCPFLDPRPFARRAPPIIVLWLFRWIIFRIMVGAFLIKWRGDECWRDYTAMLYHYETQPVPNPLSRYLHFSPVWFHKFEVAWNHIVEAIVPAFLFLPSLPLGMLHSNKAKIAIRSVSWVAAVGVVILFFVCRAWYFSPENGGDPASGEPMLLYLYAVMALACCVVPALTVGRPMPRLGAVLRMVRHTTGILLVSFQVILITSGNLSFLNWLTIVPALACFDDSFWRRVLPRFLTRRAEAAAVDERVKRDKPMRAAVHWTHLGLATAFAIMVAVLSVPVVKNLCSQRQAMNASLSPLSQKLHFVNTYGAFGTVGRERYELVFEGTDEFIPNEVAKWQPYEFKVKPGDLKRRPAIITPYHHRLDWQIWFAAMASPNAYPWTVSFTWRLLENEPGTLSLIEKNPFPDKPPRYIRVVRYRYKFAPPDNADGAWWTRERMDMWLPPVSLQNANIRNFLTTQGWLPRE
jgi:hypothetical protein